MAGRRNGARIYFNDAELETVVKLKEQMGMSESSTLRFLVLRGLKSIQNPDEETQALQRKLMNLLDDSRELNIISIRSA